MEAPMDNENNVGFTEEFLDLAYRALALSSAKTEYDREVTRIISRACAKNGISFRKYMAILFETNEAILKLQQENEQ